MMTTARDRIEAEIYDAYAAGQNSDDMEMDERTDRIIALITEALLSEEALWESAEALGRFDYGPMPKGWPVFESVEHAERYGKVAKVSIEASLAAAGLTVTGGEKEQR